jgi:glutathione S-transferase
MTVADIYAFVVSNWANGLLPTKLENYPNIRKLHEEITKLESVQKII